MNICYPGACICDAAEWEGDTDCFGAVVGGCREPVVFVEQRYYLDYEVAPQFGPVTLSVDVGDEKPGVQYFYDADLTRPVSETPRTP